MINKRIYLYELQNQKLVSRFIITKIFKYRIGLNMTNILKINEIIHLSNHQKGDIGIINILKIFMLYMKVDLVNRFKIFDENLVEDNRSNLKIYYCIRSLINQGKRLVIALYKVDGNIDVPSLT